MKQPAILVGAAGVVGGVALGSWLDGSFVVAALLVLGACFWLAKNLAILYFLVGALVGFVRITLSPLIPSHYDVAHLAGQPVACPAEVVSIPEMKRSSQLTVARVSCDAYTGKTLITTERFPKLHLGDSLEVRGTLKEPPVFEGFDYRTFLAKDHIHTVMTRPEIRVVGHRQNAYTTLFALRESFSTHLQLLFSEPSSSFLLGILLGEKSALPDTLADSFRRTGLSHVVVLSGYNISILIAVVVGLLGRKTKALWLSLAFIASFVCLVGPSASVLRAALMGGFLLLGTIFGRPQTAILACVVAAAALLLAKPWSLKYDLGFDLSFLATIGLLWLEDPVRRMLGWLPALVKEPASATIAASIPTLPLIAATFGTVSLVSPLANIVVVPLVPWLMLGGFAATALSYLSMTLASGLAVAVGRITQALLAWIEQLAQLPLASVGVGNNRLVVVPVLIAVAVLLSIQLKVRQHA